MLVAAEAGADMVGVNFVPGVRRRVEPAFAREMVAQFRASSSRCVLVVGLFADQPADEVVRIAGEVGCRLGPALRPRGTGPLAKGRPPFLEVRSRP